MAHHEKAAAAQVARFGQAGRQGKARCHGRVDGVAALFQDPGPDLGSQRMTRYDDPLAAAC